MEYECSVCHKKIKGDALKYMDHAQEHIIDQIKAENPKWVEKDGLCQKCEEHYRKEIKGE